VTKRQRQLLSALRHQLLSLQRRSNAAAAAALGAPDSQVVQPVLDERVARCCRPGKGQLCTQYVALLNVSLQPSALAGGVGFPAG
jgi:hypothetical protein